MRFFLHLAYRGDAFHGWQSQPGDVATVQTAIEQALAILLRRPVPIVGAGRTDTGVNALNMVTHLDLRAHEGLGDAGTTLVRRLGALLPRTIALYSLTPVTAHANARYDALWRTYHYHITHLRDPFLSPLALWMPNAPDYDLMNRAAADLLGRHDFTSLSRTHTQTHTNLCTVTCARWIRRGDGRAIFVITADRFLRGMVRAAVGTLLEVGRRRLAPDALRDILKARDRRAAGQAAPPEALFLAGIDYPFYHQADGSKEDVIAL